VIKLWRAVKACWHWHRWFYGCPDPWSNIGLDRVSYRILLDRWAAAEPKEGAPRRVRAHRKVVQS